MTDLGQASTAKDNKGWYSRGYLPHYDVTAGCQFITYRLSDSLPATVLERLKHEKHNVSKNETIELYSLIEKSLDNGYGSCYLSDSRIAEIVQDALFFFNDKRYILHSWVIMPNHVHVLISLCKGYRLPDILHSWRSFTAQKANALLNRRGTFWQKEYFDRFIRSPEHYAYVVKYIEENPVKAGLCLQAEDWLWSSARMRREKSEEPSSR